MFEKVLCMFLGGNLGFLTINIYENGLILEIYTLW